MDAFQEGFRWVFLRPGKPLSNLGKAGTVGDRRRLISDPKSHATLPWECGLCGTGHLQGPRRHGQDGLWGLFLSPADGGR